MNSRLSHRLLPLLILGTCILGGLPSLHAATPTVVQTRQRQAQQLRYFEQIKNMPFDWRKVGSVLEAVAEIELGKTYPPPRYEILSGIHYLNEEKRGVGELDIVVWDAPRRRAIAVYEVKVSENLSRVRGHARGQMTRFKNAIENKQIQWVISDQYPERHFSPEQFDSVHTFGIIGSKGALSLGFDLEMDMTREEAADLQEKLLEYIKQKDSRKTKEDRAPKGYNQIRSEPVEKIPLAA